ncbi:MAG: response regulator transcription factor [Christensenellales bacterium]|jgi:two-component system OmpR family response regulator
MPEKDKVLIVDDDPNIGHLISLYMDKEGFEPLVATNGNDAVRIWNEQPVTLMLLDVMLPGKDGWEVLRECRKTSDMPIIMLTAKDQTFDKVMGLEQGADDYITKPFDVQELLARVRAVLRRSNPQGDDDKKVVYDNLQIDMNTYIVTYKGRQQHMPPKEIELLYYLASHPNHVYTREQLLEQVWGFDFFGDSRTVDVHIKRLREKVGGEDESWQIKTVWGVGYKFEVK